jgi:Tol biopolymer transport system component
LDSAADARLEIEEAMSSPADDQTPVSPTPRGWRSVPRSFVALAAVLLAAVAGLAALALVHLREKPSVVQSVQFEISVPPNVTMGEGDFFEISPDGRKLAFMARGADRVTRLWVRDLNAREARALPGSENAEVTFFWSFDSRSLVFQSSGRMRRIDLVGGPAKTLCDVPSALIGGFSTSEGVIIFGTGQTAVNRVSSDGGTPVAVTRSDSARQETYHALPSPLPDGRHFLYLRVSSNPENSGIFVGSVDAKSDDPPSRMVLATGYGARFVRSSEAGHGHLLFLRNGGLVRQGFDTRTLTLTGEPTPVAGQVGSFFAAGFFSATNDGTIVYRTGSGLNRQLTWFDRHGMKTSIAGEVDGYLGVALAPDGARAIATRLDSQTNQDLWLLDFARATRARFAFGRFRLGNPVWTPDSQRAVFGSNQLGPVDLYEKRLGGAGEERLLFKSGQNKTPTSVSPDGRDLLFHTVPASDLWLLPLRGGDLKPVPLLATPFNELEGRFSPDGRWIAYQSNESGRNEVYVRAFDAQFPERFSASDKVLVSRNGGAQPHWRTDGKELFYGSEDGRVMAVSIPDGAAGGPPLQTGTPVPLFALPANAITTSWAPASDGQRFLLLLPAADTTQAPFTVLLNWAAGPEK